ncbi:hypothetical protein [Pseudoponticoccus marisrubri]|uniref:Uncharacterized protein n=1 Tax=Pseudoponticoccus marisrubri TaxID=1685382 RepID=A0A0W7WPN9_9RHOB|nr:hypothetical protein [Pseudoponticoccus marisrubri]KUF12558.1 hypothetical protein AVJ23_02185 [Pseudoponticoccus marisrubri]
MLFPHLHDALPDDPVQMASLADSAVAARRQAERLHDDLRARIAAERPDTVVLSCENQFRAFDATAMARLCQTCATLAETVEVAVYLRAPAPFFLSNVQQDVKKRPEFRWISPSRVRDVLEPFVTHGPGPVTARRFARDALVGGDAVTDFVTTWLPGLDPAALSRGAAEENSSVSAEAMALLQEMFRGQRPLPGRYARDLKGLRKRIVALDAQLPGQTRPVLFDAVRDCVEARVADLDWTDEVLGVRFPEMGAPALSRSEAETLYAGLHDVADICTVDAARKEALWQAACDEARPLARLARRLGLR